MATNKMTPEQAMNRLKELIAIELDSCNKFEFPYVCHMASKPEGRRAIEEMVIEQCRASGISVGKALDRIERMYNPNRIED